jgi:hypothetical protein
MELHNLEIRRVQDWRAYERETYFETVTRSQPKDVFLSIIVYWVFLDQNNTSHSVTANLEITYFDGIDYQKLTLPITLGVLTG